MVYGAPVGKLFFAMEHIETLYREFTSMMSL